MFLTKKTLAKKIFKFLQEDIGQGDITAALIPPDTIVEAEVIAKEGGILGWNGRKRCFSAEPRFPGKTHGIRWRKHQEKYGHIKNSRQRKNPTVHRKDSLKLAFKNEWHSNKNPPSN